MDISEGKATPRVRAFIARLLVWRNRGLVRLFAFGAGVSVFNSQAESYVRGAVSCAGSVEKAAIENSTLGRSRYLDRGIPKKINVTSEGGIPQK